MKKFLKNIKKNFIYRFLILNFFLFIYEFFWQYIINFKSKLLYFYYKYSTNTDKYYDLSKSSFLLVRNDEDYKKIAEQINFELTSSKIEKIKKDFIIKFNSEKNIKDYSIDLTNHISEKLKKKLIDFSLNSKNLNTATNYLKVLPYLSKVKLYMNIPLNNKTPKFAMLWHRDDFGYKSLDLFLAIRAIDNSNGPLHYVNNNSFNNVFLQVPDENKEKIKGERNKHSLEHFDKFVNEENISSFLGDAGDGLWIDSFRVYHRGGQCFKNDRFVLRLSYQTPDNTRSNNSNDEYFFYDQNIKKTNIKKILEKHYFFGHKSFLISKLNLTKKLIYLYRLVSIKMNKKKI